MIQAQNSPLTVEKLFDSDLLSFKLKINGIFFTAADCQPAADVLRVLIFLQYVCLYIINLKYTKNVIGCVGKCIFLHTWGTFVRLLSIQHWKTTKNAFKRIILPKTKTVMVRLFSTLSFAEKSSRRVARGVKLAIDVKIRQIFSQVRNIFAQHPFG